MITVLLALLLVIPCSATQVAPGADVRPGLEVFLSLFRPRSKASASA